MCIDFCYFKRSSSFHTPLRITSGRNCLLSKESDKNGSNQKFVVTSALRFLLVPFERTEVMGCAFVVIYLSILYLITSRYSWIPQGFLVAANTYFPLATYLSNINSLLFIFVVLCFLRVVPVPGPVTRCALTSRGGRSTPWGGTWIPLWGTANPWKVTSTATTLTPTPGCYWARTLQQMEAPSWCLIIRSATLILLLQVLSV